MSGYDSREFQRRWTPPAFDPFRSLPLMAFTRGWRSRRFALLAPVLILIGVVASAVSGSLGGLRDFTPAVDSERLFGIGHPHASPATFPFARDYPSWLFVMCIVLTYALVHAQWKAMRSCFPELAANGVIRPRREARCNWYQRLLRIDRLAAAARSEYAVDNMLQSCNRSFDRIASFGPVTALVTVGIVALLMLSEQRNGVFEVLAPPRLSDSARQAWISASYHGWWAGSNHTLGVFVYAGIASLGLFLIVSQNIVGFVAVYCVMALPAVVEFDADWINRDGCYGWSPLGRTFRTVCWSIALHGVAISLLLVTLGIENFRWVLVLAITWIVILPLYLVVPILIFRKVSKTARKAREIEVQSGFFEAIYIASPIEVISLEAQARSELEAARAARIRPLRVGRLEVSAFIVTILLPIVLTVIQLVFSVSFGGGSR